MSIQLLKNQKVVSERKKDRREGKGRVLAISHRIYYLKDSDAYYVESESSDNKYYLVKFKSGGLQESYCSCKDNSIRGLKCKHLFAIEFAIEWGTIKDIDKIPIANIIADQNTSNNISETQPVELVTKRTTTKSYLEDDYDF